MTDKRATARSAFAKGAVKHMRKRYGVDVAVVDLDYTWAIMRTDGANLTPEQTRGFWLFRSGYKLFGADV